MSEQTQTYWQIQDLHNVVSAILDELQQLRKDLQFITRKRTTAELIHELMEGGE